jgi:hypothetical protein
MSQPEGGNPVLAQRIQVAVNLVEYILLGRSGGCPCPPHGR